MRSTENGKRYGTRTGRLSSSNPNFQNVPTAFTQKIPEGLPPLPFMRRFLLPEEHCVWLKRDWSAQEIRIAAHFEDGPLLAAFRETPDLDPHQMTKELILLLTNKDFDRKHVKITGFQTLYGGGAPAISLQVGCTLAEGAELKNAYFTASPGIRDLVKDCASIGRGGLAITTWGGRKYFKEVSLKHPGKDFSYKLINYLIQGSAADQTKECLCRWYDAKDDGTDFLATVHDELNISVPADIVKQEMQVLKDHMEAPLFDCPMRSEGFKGPNWHDIKEYM